jgi:hypothetical protein
MIGGAMIRLHLRACEILSRRQPPPLRNKHTSCAKMHAWIWCEILL